MFPQLIWPWLFGCLIVTNWMLVWHGTGFPVHLFRCRDWDDLKNYWEFGLPRFWGELFGCCVCFSHWWSVAVSTILWWHFDLPWEFIPVSVFTWPLLCFIILKKLGVIS